MADLDVSDDPVAERILLEELRELRMSAGQPALRGIAARAGLALATVQQALSPSQDRVPSDRVVEGIVTALNGDVSRFRILHELVIAERNKLDEKFDRLVTQLRLRERVEDLRRSQSAQEPGWSVGLSMLDPMRDQELRGWAAVPGFRENVPDETFRAYVAAGNGIAIGASNSVLALCRWILEAILLDKGIDSKLASGLEQLFDQGLISGRTYVWARDASNLIDTGMHAVGHISDEAVQGVYSLIGTLLFQLYVVDPLSPG